MSSADERLGEKRSEDLLQGGDHCHEICFHRVMGT